MLELKLSSHHYSQHFSIPGFVTRTQNPAFLCYFTRVPRLIHETGYTTGLKTTHSEGKQFGNPCSPAPAAFAEHKPISLSPFCSVLSYIKSLLLLALIFPPYPVFLFPLNPNFSLQNETATPGSSKHETKKTGFQPLTKYNILSSHSFDQRPIHLCLYTPAPRRETLKLTLQIDFAVAFPL